MSLNIKTASGLERINGVYIKPSSVDISPDLMGYTAGDTDLGNGFTVVNSAGTIESGAWTINGHDYSGLRLFGSSTIQTPFIPWSVPGTSVETNIVPKAWNPSTSDYGHRDFTPKYGSDGAWTFSLYTVYSSSYICYNIDGCTVLDTDNLVRRGSYSDYNDISLPKQNIIGTEMLIKLKSDGEYITMYVNGVAKAKKPITTDMWRASIYSIGGNGTDCDDIIVTSARIHIEKEV